ncbi:MAG: archaemetzincin family Zn-dependent metalloprotease [Calditrichia bacterium]
MAQTIYLGFINNCFSGEWRKIAGELARSLPFEFRPLRIQLDLKLSYSEDRNQYHSTLILSRLLDHLPPDGYKIVGVTAVDIYVPILTFLFGEAQFKGNGALVSTHRLYPEFYGLPVNPILLHQRLLKEILHELGHTLGLVHCPNYECVMKSSTYVEDIDLKKTGFCSSCRQEMAIAG